MAWTTVPTFTSGQILTAAQMNGIGDDLNELRGDYAISRYSAGDLTLNSTTWANVGGPADLVLAADAGDVVQVVVSSLINNEAIELALDVQTIVSSAAVNSFGTGTTVSNSSRGIAGWQRPASISMHLSGSFFYKLVAGDISGGNVTLRLRYRTLTAGNRTMFAATDYPITFIARNHGPVEI